MMREQEFDELRTHLMVASQNYLSVVAEVDQVLRELNRPVSNTQLTLWHALREKEQRYKQVYDAAIDKLSKALGESRGGSS
jgi:hypothetical protein